MKLQRPQPEVALPQHAIKKFEGAIFDVYQWEQELYDGSTATFERLSRADTVVVIPVTEEGMIVVTDQEQPGKLPFVGFAGGRVEVGEDPLAAAARELKEETGYEAREFVLMEAVQPIAKIDWAVYTLIARGCREVGKQELDAGEKISLRLITFDELLTMAREERLHEVQVTLALLKAQLDQEKMQELRELFFGSS